MTDILLITPPFTQLNTPYPATAYLKGFLNTKNISSFQLDVGLEVILKLFSKNGLQDLFKYSAQQNKITSSNAQRIFALKEIYIQVIDDVILFLQGKNQTFGGQICTEGFLPEASRFESLEDMDWAFGTMGVQDKAKHLATLFLEDISDFIVECVDPNFGFSRYAEKLGRSANSFDELHSCLQQDISYIDHISLQILDEQLKRIQPKLVCFSIPFPGNLYSAFRCAQFIKKYYPEIKITMGGGFPNTELRSVSDARVFDFFDYITLDDGELPLELLVSHILNPTQGEVILKRTFLKENGKVIFNNSSQKEDYSQAETGTPDYSDLFLDKYISVIEIINPMHSLWSDGRWNKLTMAHGCYWHKCAFCDVSLSYIKDYEPLSAKILVDKIEQLIAQTGEKGFHFVDEAAPPMLMRDMALEIIRRKLNINWWTNIRFEKSFTKDLCILLKASGCIAVSGGLEVASDRLLALINKGTTVEQVAQVSRNFSEAGIMVHAYLMYGFPSQTVQETIDSLEMVRQLFELGIIQSGFWHQFALTAHSGIGKNPSQFGIIPDIKKITFADNDIQFKDKTGIKHEEFSYGLSKSLFNFMHGICFDFPLQEWFEFKIPHTTVKKNFILNCLKSDNNQLCKPTSKIIWLGNSPAVTKTVNSKKGETKEMLQMTFHSANKSFNLLIEKEKEKWFLQLLTEISVYNETVVYYENIKKDFESHFDYFELFWYSKSMNIMRENGLLVL